MKESFVASILLTLIIAAGIYIRADGAIEPIWLDECHTAWTVDADDMTEVASRAADGNQPPLYFLLVWLVAQAIGLSEFSLRLVSLVAGSGLLIAAPFFAWKLSNRWSAAVLVAGLIAFDGQFIYYSGEARSYALVQLLGLVQAMLFWRMLPLNAVDKHAGNGNATLLAWSLLSILLLYCHYTSMWIIAAEAVVILALSFQERRIPRKFILGLIAIAISLVPRLWNISMVYSRRSNWDSVSSTGRLWTDIEPWLVHWILIPAACGFAAWLFHLAKGKTPDKSKESSSYGQIYLWMIIWASIGPAGIALLDGLGIAPVALLRYSAVCWVAMALFAGACLNPYPKIASWVIAAAILLSSFFGNWWASELYAFRTLPTFRSQDWVTTVEQIADNDAQLPTFQMADVIEDIDAFSNIDERFQEYLKFPVLGANAIAQSELDSEQLFVLPTWNIQFSKSHIDAIISAEGCWLVVRGEFEYAVHVPGELEKYLDQSIEFKFIPNDQMPNSEVHLIKVRLIE